MTWFVLWCKRLLHKPLIIFTILLIPLSVLFLRNCHTEKDAVLRVALYSENPTNTELLEQMTSLSNSSIYFYRCDSKNELINDVKRRKANCGYIIPENLDERIRSYIETRKPFLTVVRDRKDTTTKIVDEIILSKNFRAVAFQILENFLRKHPGSEAETEKITEIFDSHCSNELLFQFQYLNGEENTIMQSKDTGILMLPLRGILTALMLLTCMSGYLLYFDDNRQGITQQMTQKQKRLAALYSTAIPGLAAGIFALISIKIAGISGSLTREIPALLCYLFACVGLTQLTGRLCRQLGIYLASLPVIFLLSLLLPPVFIDISQTFPPAGMLGKLLPATWYLKAVQEPQNLPVLLAYGTVCLTAANFTPHIKFPKAAVPLRGR